MADSMNRVNLRMDCACDTVQSALQYQNDTQTGTDTKTDTMQQYYSYMAEDFNKREGSEHLEDGYHCDICKNKGYIRKAEYSDVMGYWTTVDYACQCMSVRQNIRRMKRSGLQNMLERCRFDTYHTDEPWQQTVKTRAQEYAERVLKAEPAEASAPKAWFFMGGASGAGKSHICTAICRELLFHGKTVRYMMWRDESVKLKASVNDTAQYEKAVQELKTVEVLYIDDLFKGSQTDGDLKLAFEILNARYNNANAITIVSSELPMNGIFALDEAVGGRIGERTQGYAINLSGTDKNYRRKMMGIAV